MEIYLILSTYWFYFVCVIIVFLLIKLDNKRIKKDIEKTAKEPFILYGCTAPELQPFECEKHGACKNCPYYK